MLVQPVNLPEFYDVDQEVERDQEIMERDELLRDDGEDRDDGEEYLQDDGEEDDEMPEPEVKIIIALSNEVHFSILSQIFSNPNPIPIPIKQVVRGRRGKDLEWQEWQVFETKEEWESSAVVDNLKTDFTLRTGKLTSCQVHHCRFARKKGFNCGVKVKLIFSDSDDRVIVKGVGEHNHEQLQVQEGQQEKEGRNLCWTAQQTNVVMTGVLNEATPTVIRRNLRELFPEGNLPSAIQIANKIAHCRKQVNATKQVLTTGDLRKLIAENSEIDFNDENKSNVAFNEVVDDEGQEGVRFTVIFTTPSLAARMSPELIQDDATYRFSIWKNFPNHCHCHHHCHCHRRHYFLFQTRLARIPCLHIWQELLDWQVIM